jgi:hypothetical protein
MCGVGAVKLRGAEKPPLPNPGDRLGVYEGRETGALLNWNVPVDCDTLNGRIIGEEAGVGILGNIRVCGVGAVKLRVAGKPLLPNPGDRLGENEGLKTGLLLNRNVPVDGDTLNSDELLDTFDNPAPEPGGRPWKVPVLWPIENDEEVSRSEERSAKVGG